VSDRVSSTIDSGIAGAGMIGSAIFGLFGLGEQQLIQAALGFLGVFVTPIACTAVKAWVEAAYRARRARTNTNSTGHEARTTKE
jgi:hypothetical protein